MPNSDPTVGMRDVTELSDLVVTGELSLQETGRLVTSTSTAVDRVIVTSTAVDRIVLAGDTGTNGEIWGWDGNVGVASGGSTGKVLISVGSVLEIYDNQALATICTIGGAASPSTYDPVLQVLTGTSQPSVGTESGFIESGLYSQMGSQVIAHVTICWSSAGTPGNGVYVICPPKKIHSSLIVGGSVGGGRILDASGNDTWVVDARKAGSTKVNLRFTGTTGSNVTNASPFACGSSDDQFDIHLSYLTTE